MKEMIQEQNLNNSELEIRWRTMSLQMKQIGRDKKGRKKTAKITLLKVREETILHEDSGQ